MWTSPVGLLIRPPKDDSSKTRSKGTSARPIAESKDACAAITASPNEAPATGTVTGMKLANQPGVTNSAGVLRWSYGVIAQYVSAPVSSYSAKAAQANTPPLKRAPAFVQVASNRSV